jgi:hypothetical protein
MVEVPPSVGMGGMARQTGSAVSLDGMGNRVTLRSAPECDDRKMSPAEVTDVEIEPDSRLATDESVRCRTGRTPRPPSAWLEARCAAGKLAMMVALVGSGCAEPRVGPVAVVPGDVERQFPLHGGQLVGYDAEAARALVLERPDASFNHSEAAVLTDGAEALPDAAASTPTPEPSGDELPAVVGDEMPRLVTYHTTNYASICGTNIVRGTVARDMGLRQRR